MGIQNFKHSFGDVELKIVFEEGFGLQLGER
jgi:hypothetical protein